MTTTRHKLFATWKNQVGLRRSLELSAVAAEYGARCEALFELVVCPSMTALAPVAEVITGKVAIAAQNLIWDATNSFTGETSASSLTDIGCKYVILGHSERRRYLGETDEMISRKLSTACAHFLTPVLCVGETLAEHQNGQFEQVVSRQLTVLFSALPEAHPFVIAYEPAWAISTSTEALVCKPSEAGDRHAFLRDTIAHELGQDRAGAITILYGGSVAAPNVAEYLAETEIDGGFVGKASQELTPFRLLVDATIAVYLSQVATSRAPS